MVIIYMRNYLKKIISFIFLFLVGWQCSFAADQLITLKLQKEKISPGKQTQLEATFLNTTDVSAPEIPFIDGLNIKFVKSQVNPAPADGSTAGSVTHIYRVTALKSGSFMIGPIVYEHKGVTYRSDSVSLTVEKEEPVSKKAPSERAEVDMSKHISLVLNVPRPTVFINEKVPITVSVYSDWLDLENINLFQESSEHLISKKFEDRTVNIVERDGVKYAVLEYKSAFFALVAGQYTLAPVEVKMDVARPAAQGGAEPELLNNNMDVYDEFIGTANSRPFELRTQPFTLTVLPLPKEGQSPEFKGAVGSFNFDASASPLRIKLGEVVTLKMTITGSGNYDTVRAPDIPKIDGIKIYEPQATKTKDSVTYEQALRVQSADVKEIPEAIFTFFDPEAKKYVMVKKGPFAISIEGAEVKKPEEITEIKVPQARIIDVKDSTGGWGSPNISLYRCNIFPAMAILPIFLIVASVATKKRIVLLQTNPQYAALLAASKKARRGIKNAEGLLRKGNAQDFYDAIFKTMQAYLGQRSFIPAGGVTAKVLEGLSGLGIEKEVAEKIQGIFSQCYMAKYSPADLKKEDMTSILEETKYVIKDLDKKKFK